MPVLYKSKCYDDISIVRDILASDPDFTNVPFYPTVVDSDTINIVTDPGDLINGVIYNRETSDFDLPVCSQLGLSGSFIGITFTDGQELAWMLVLVLVIAYSSKILKRVF